jgi:tRNA(Ile2) C34 agmatinyltransferase TiaS
MDPDRGATGRVGGDGMAEFVDTRPVELATFRCPRCRRKMEELARARLTCPLCGVRMVKQKAGPVLVDFQCPDCSRRLAAVPSAVVRCKCGQVMETTQAVAIGRETGMIQGNIEPKTAVYRRFHAEKRSF